MTGRSQRHKREIQGVDSPGNLSLGGVAVAGILPDTAAIAAAGAVNRTIATLSATGGTGPFSFSIAAAAGLDMNILGNLLRTNANPVGTVGVKAVQITATDQRGMAKTEALSVTVS